MLAGRPIVSHVIERFAATGQFAPIVVAGPRRIYADHVDDIVDTDGPLHTNVQRALEELRRRGYEGAIAVTTCDILPTPEDLAAHTASIAGALPCAAWFALVRAPEQVEELGASDWKPSYRLRPAPGEEPVRVLPGHLIVANPDRLRLGLCFRLVDLAYRTRNRPIVVRRRVLTTRLLANLLLRDLDHLLHLRRPDVTWTILRHGLRVARGMRAGTMSQEELEDAAERILVHSRARRGGGAEARIHLPILPGFSLAEDADTAEEAADLAARVRQEGAAPGDPD